MYNLRPFFVPLCRMRDNHGRGPVLTVIQGMQFASVRLSGNSEWRTFPFADINKMVVLFNFTIYYGYKSY